MSSQLLIRYTSSSPLTITIWTQSRVDSHEQIELNPYNYAENVSLLEYHSKHGIVTEAYGILSFVFHLFNDMELKYKVFSRSITTLPGGPVDAVVEKSAKRLSITPTQVLLLWAKAKGAVIVTFVILNTEFSIPDV